MIIVTGGAGFIGSALVWKLNEQGFKDILIVDRLGEGQKWRNLSKRSFLTIAHKDDFIKTLVTNPKKYGNNVEAVFHLGACSSTTQTDVDYLVGNNLNYSIALFEWCRDHQVPFIYASSAATYGMGEAGFDDSRQTMEKLIPINPYGFSKHVFDKWVVAQKDSPPFWAGLKFFNVFGPNEYHKGSQASVAYHAFSQIQESAKLKLFKSQKPGIQDGHQKRDFVYVKDVVDVMFAIFQNRKAKNSWVYNLGTARAETFLDLAKSCFQAMDKKPEIQWVETPLHIAKQYQYFTEASMTTLRSVFDYQKPFLTLNEAIADYYKNYLFKEDAYL